MGWVDDERRELVKVLTAARRYRDACKVAPLVGVIGRDQPWTIAKRELVAAVDRYEDLFGTRHAQ